MATTFLQFLKQRPDVKRGTESHGTQLVLPDDSYIIFTQTGHEYADPADSDVTADAARYENPDGDDEECVAWAPGITCAALFDWVQALERRVNTPKV